MFLGIKTRINLLQFTRHNNEYTKKAYRSWFEQYIDFAGMNNEYIQQSGSSRYVIAYDLSCLKSRTNLPLELANTAGQTVRSRVSQKVLWGLEVGLVSVIDKGLY